MPPAGHFCPHGNLRYSCAKCRAERQAKRAPPKRQTYGRPLGPRGEIPKRPWSLEEALTPVQQAAVQATSGKDGVVLVPAILGLRRVAYTLLRGLRHEADGILFVVPNARALEAWSEALRAMLNVPSEEIDDTARAVRDWQRLATVVLWTPEALARNKSGLRQNAARFALFVDSPESDAYIDVLEHLALPFKRRIGVSAARLGPLDATAWRGLDALGGIVHQVSVRDAIRDGSLRDVRHHWVHVKDPEDVVRPVIDTVRRLTEKGKIVVHVMDTATGRDLEAAANSAGIAARFVADAASPEGAARSARAVAEGGARLLVRTSGAPPTPTGPVDVLVHADPDATALRRAHADLAAGAEGVRRLDILDLVPEAAPDEATTRRLAERAVDVAHSYGAPVPALPWLLEAFDVPPLPNAARESMAERAADGWHTVLGLLPDLLADGIQENAAVAALADAYIATRLDTADRPIGPAPVDASLLLAAGDGAGLPSLALLLSEARPAFAAVLDHDIAAFLDAYAAAPLLHHLVPDARALLVATLETMRASRVPSLPRDPVEAADLLLRRGEPLPPATRFDAVAPPRPLSPEPHMERLLEALEAEKRLETEESVQEIERLTAKERQRQGRTLLGLELIGKQRTASGLALRYALPAGRGGARPALPYTELSPGALVDLTSGTDYDPLGRGTVSSIDAYEVTVLVEEDRERRAPGKDARIDLVGNPRIYDLLARGVRLVYGAGGLAPGSAAGGLKDHLLERATPQNPEQVALHAFGRLDPSQRAAVGACLGAAALSLVHGPPGTGKTTTLVELLLQETTRGNRVLVTADSNAAVDTIMDAYLRAGGVGVRTGPRPSLTRPHLAPFHVDNLTARAPGIAWLARLPVVFTTHVSSASLPRDLSFDLVVQDEASQATEAASCASLVRAPRLVLAGDHLQLPPVVRSPEAERLGLKVSLFERLHLAYGATLGHLLSVQYRMHRDIERWSNEEFYQGRIETAVDPPFVAPAVDAGLLPAAPRALFVDVAGAETTQRTSKEREAEAEWIADHVRRLLTAGVRPEQVAVIAAYRAQVRLLRRLMEGLDVDIGTIDAFQGSERDIVIVSLVRGNPKGEVGFVREPRRLNVAMTRAKRHLLVVGHRATLEQEPLLRRLLASLAPL